MEAQLAERAVICAWRLRRVYRIETGMFSKARKFWAPTGPTMASDIETVTRGSPHNATISPNYPSMRLERSLRRALLDLDRCQARRRSERAPIRF